jgi:glycosyltransferase involved in cell wall biosynthesis
MSYNSSCRGTGGLFPGQINGGLLDRFVQSQIKCHRIVYVLTSAPSTIFLRGQLAYLRKAGFDITVMSSAGPELESLKETEGVAVHAIRIAREISPIRDLVSVWQIFVKFRELRPTITNVGTPKAGLLAGVAAWLSGVPCRIYTLHGLRCERERGWRFRLLSSLERISCRVADRVIVVSESLRAKVVNLRLVDPRKAIVLGSGSCNGVELSRFDRTPALSEMASALRDQLKLSAPSQVIGYVGRLTRDKGVPELVRTYLILERRFLGLRLLLVGDFEIGDPLPVEIRKEIESNPKIVKTGFVDDPAAYYHLMDVFVLATHREGFPVSVLEAHAARRPIAGTRATGVVDAVRDGQDGLLSDIGEVDALTENVSKLLSDPHLAERLANAGHNRVRGEFKPANIWNELEKEYRNILIEKGFRPNQQTAQVSLSSDPACRGVNG